MLKEMPASLMAEWEYFFAIEPFGAEVEELRFGHIMATLANINRSKNSPVFKPSDFMTTIQPPPPREQTPEEQLAILQGMFCGL